MKRLNTLLAILVLLVSTLGHAFAADYDLVILNGRVMDPETNFDGVRCDHQR
jgi:N-acyl-D-glutamate deacylase